MSLLEVTDLRTYFRTDAGVAKSVDGVSFSIAAGEVLGIVGESGSGKSVTSLSLMRLVPQPPGDILEGSSIRWRGEELLSANDRRMREIRGNEIAMIFQEPMTSLNPVFTIGDQIGETVRLHRKLSKKDAREESVKMLRLVGIPNPEDRVDHYPHQLSGGQRQRVMIAMALSCEPALLIADEPTTALDVTIQAQILGLIAGLRERLGMAIMLITHDLGVVAGMTDHVIVMYAGKIFEQAKTSELFALPGNPYTKGLLRSVPDPTAEQGKLYQIPGLPPDVAHLKPGCPFAPRCDKVAEICHREFPPFVQLNADHYSLCHFAREVYAESGGGRVS